MRADPKPASAWRETAARLSCIHRANVVDTSHGEIKANRVPAFAARAIRHRFLPGKIDMQIYAQILVISLYPPCSLCATARVRAIQRRRYPFPAPFAHTIYSPQLLSPHSLRLSLSLARASRTQFSLYRSVYATLSFSAREERAFVHSLGVLSSAAGMVGDQGRAAGRGLRQWETGERL